ncbi:MAG: ABC transporter permease [Lachnospiraceae bacterium]|nr:ABC transporter permease [Lachnospiraceae bacterium]
MYKLFVIAKNNMKKQKGDMITFFILTFMAAFLIFDAASALLGMGKVLDSRFEEIEAPHFLLFSHDTQEEKECIEKAVREQECITDYEATPCIMMVAEHKKEGEKDYSQYKMIAVSFDQQPRLMHDIKEGETYGKNDILLPLHMQTTYAIGDTMKIKIGDHVYDLHVAGYVADPYFCSTINLTIYYLFLSDDMIAQMKADEPDYAESYWMNKAVMDESYLGSSFTTQDLEKNITDRYKELIKPYADEHPERSYTDYLSVNWQMMRGGSQFVPMIVMAIMLLFAVIIIVIAIVIISFSIQNFIQRNMKNTGILEASGYTVKQLRGALSFQIVLVSFLGSLVGTILAAVTFSGFGKVITMAMGMEWNQKINLAAGILTVILPAAIIYLVSRMTSSSYKKISVLDALRGGLGAHNFKRNFFSFEKTPLPIPAVLSLKETFGGLGKNLVMTLIIALITISVLIGFGMYENFGRDPQNIIRILGFENATAIVYSSEEIGEKLSDLPEVDNVLTMFGMDLSVKKGDQEKMIYTMAMDDIENTTNMTVLEGRVAKHDNEIMMTGAACDDLGAAVGDVVTIEYAEKTAEYLITGTYQRMDRMGRTIYMTFDAAERIMPKSPVLQYWVTAKEGTDFESLQKKIKQIEKDYDTTFKIDDAGQQMEATMGVVSSAMKILCIAIAVITILVVVFVESLVIRARIVRSWRSMGISKALGMTSRQLISQIQMSNMPAILTGMLLGTMLAPVVGAQMCKIIFSLFGIQQVFFEIPALWMLVSAIGIIAVALLASGLSGLRVKGLKPVEMITEE